MIQKPNSQQLMERFENVETDIADIQHDIEIIGKQMNTKLDIIKMYNSIVLQRLNDISESVENTSEARRIYKINTELKRKQNCIIFGLDPDKIIGGNFDRYGQTVHSGFASLPSQIFNFITETGPLYKDCASVSFIYDKNNQSTTDFKYDYCNILKQEGDISKQDVFHIFEEEYVTLRIELNHTNLYGNTSCNMIEICPYLPGTFDIEQIDLYSVTQYLAEGDEMDIINVEQGSLSLTNVMKDVGTCRFMLDGNTCQIYRADFKIRIHKQNEGYPFGLRHLYFYNAQMDTGNDYIIVALNQDRYIEYVGDGIDVMTPFGTTEKIIREMGIELYMFYNNGVLDNEIKPDEILGRNLKTIYAKIPFSMSDNNNTIIPYCLTGISFKNIVLRGN